MILLLSRLYRESGHSERQKDLGAVISYQNRLFKGNGWLRRKLFVCQYGIGDKKQQGSEGRQKRG